MFVYSYYSLLEKLVITLGVYLYVCKFLAEVVLLLSMDDNDDICWLRYIVYLELVIEI